MKGRSGDEQELTTSDGLDDAAIKLSSKWQERTLERRLSNARARALARSSRFLATALELVQESGRADFTIQTLIDRSNLSLQSTT
jgi:hypothetical protein